MSTLRKGRTGSKSISAVLDKGLVIPGPFAFAALTGDLAANKNAGRIVRTTNGVAGQPGLLYSDGTNWKVLPLGANAATA